MISARTEQVAVRAEFLSNLDRLRAVREVVRKNIGSDIAKAEEIVGYCVEGGKGLRALVTHLSADWCGLDKSVCGEVAAAIEMIHVASLMHDDVIDEAGLRRHKPTANCKYGNNFAVLGGDFLYSRSSQILCRIGSQALISEVANATNCLAEGELSQLDNSGTIVTLGEYTDTIARKTAPLFAAGAAAGPLLSKNEQSVVPLRKFGKDLGVAFQMADDCIDYFSGDEKSGKYSGTDFAEGKTTLPLLCALETADLRGRRQIEHAFENRADKASFEMVKKAASSEDAFNLALQRVHEQVDRAISHLSAFPQNYFLETLKLIASDIAKLEYEN